MRIAAAIILASAAGVAQAPMSGLHPDVTLHLGKTADWVLPAEDAVWIGSTGPFAVSTR